MPVLSLKLQPTNLKIFLFPPDTYTYLDHTAICNWRQGGTKLFAVSDRKLSMIPDSRVLESNKSKKLAAIEILRTF